jgi:hypothetical protein
MQRRPGFDPEFVKRGLKSWRPIRSIGLLMTLVAACGLLLGIALAGTRKPATVVTTAVPAVALPAVLVQPFSPPAQLRDPFVRLADTSIDPRMVIPAPEGLDDAMVFDPEGRRASPEVIVQPPAGSEYPPVVPNSAPRSAPAHPR